MAIRTIFLKSGREGEPIPKEGKAEAATIYPGHLVQRSSTAGNVKIHATAGGPAAAIFAIEDSMQGNSVVDNYAINSRVQFVVCGPGDEVAAILAQGESVAVGDYLESQGDGTLRKVDAEVSVADVVVGSIVAQALEALDLSTSSDSATAIKVEVI